MALTPDTAFQLLQHAASRDRLSHAYLVVGPLGSGKEELVLKMINFLSGASHPALDAAKGDDVLVVRPAKKSRRIAVDDVRHEIEKRLHLARERGTKRVAVIVDADRMAHEAQNALLKTLEEPPRNTLLFLLTTEVGRLLPTILSRCVRVNLRPPTQRAGAGDAAMAAVRGEISKALMQPGRGDAGVALGLARQFSDQLKVAKTEFENQHKVALKEERDKYKGAPEGAWLEEKEEEYAALAQSKYNHRRTQMCSELYTWLGDCLRCAVGGEVALDVPEAAQLSQEVGARLGANDLMRRMAEIERMLANFNTNAQEALVLEVGFLSAFGPAGSEFSGK